MKLTAGQAQAVDTGRKTTHRVAGYSSCWRAGRRVPIRTNDGTVCHVEIVAVEATMLGDLTRAQAQAEGFSGARGPLKFKRAWLTRHDQAWVTKREAEDDGLSDELVARRFADRHAGNPIVVLTWQLTIAPDRFLARGAGTTSQRRSIDPEAPYLVPDELYVRAARQLADEQRASFRADLEEERARRKRERGITDPRRGLADAA